MNEHWPVNIYNVWFHCPTLINDYMLCAEALMLTTYSTITVMFTTGKSGLNHDPINTLMFHHKTSDSFVTIHVLTWCRQPLHKTYPFHFHLYTNSTKCSYSWPSPAYNMWQRLYSLTFSLTRRAYIKNKSGSNTEPWSNPHFSVLSDAAIPRIQTYGMRSVK